MYKNNLLMHNNFGDIMYYINCFFIYSILGHVIETLISMITGNGFKSGILNGWWTPVYGIGAVTILLVSEYLFKNLHMHRFWETIIMFFVVAIVLSTIEAIGGVLIEKIYDKVFWDYSQHKFHIGHYISLEMTLVWGISSVIFVYLIHPILDGIIKKIPIWVTFILITLFIADNVKTFIDNKKV